MNPILALLCSLIAPGAGQIFNGQYGKGIIFAVVFALGKSVLLPLFIRLFHVRAECSILRIFLFSNRLFAALILYAVLDAFYESFFVSRGQILTALVSALVIISVYKNTFNNFFFTLLSGRSGLYQILRPHVKSTTENKR